MNARRGLLWWGFWAGAAVVLGALALASVAVVRLEARNEASRAQAHRQEVLRLALWRLDSQLAPIIAAEAARTRAPDAWARSEPFASTPFVEGFFSVDAQHNIDASDERSMDVAGRLAAGSGATKAAAAMEAAPPGAALESVMEPHALLDFQARRQVADLARGPERVATGDAAPPAEAAPAARMATGAFTAAPAVAPVRLEPRWVASAPDRIDLVLVRTVASPEGPRTEGVRLDWPALRAALEASLADLAPECVVVPSHGEAAARIERDGRGFPLATIPALLVPGDLAVPAGPRMTPALWALVITWVAAVGALGAVGLVLRATLRLSDRRARFVGAVTHELRTPLTTFRLYAQMLAGGMVSEEARAEYLGTLERESVRLGEIVENVLEYARLTRRRPGAGRPPGERPVTASELLARVRPALSRRAEQSGMDLIVSAPFGADDPGPTVTCDPRSVERILMNLVENACKYALTPEELDGDEADTRIHLDVSATDRNLEMLVADHGRGVPRRERERVFGEFQRGPGAAEGSRPGLGLGLALSRGLAREMGGDLRMTRRRGHGAEFLLTLPRTPGVPANAHARA